MDEDAEGESKVKTQVKIVLLTLALAAIAMAQETKVYREGDAWIEETTGALPAQHNLKLITNLGSVHIQGGAANNISYVIKKRVYSSSEQEARRAFELIHVSANTEGDTVVLYGQGPRSYRRRSYSADFDIRTPRGLELVNAHTGSGNLAVNSIHGPVKAQTAGGKITLHEITG